MALFTFMEYNNDGEFINHHGFKRNVPNMFFIRSGREQNGSKPLPEIEEVCIRHRFRFKINFDISLALIVKESKVGVNWLNSDMFTKVNLAQIGRIIGMILEIIMSTNKNMFPYF